MKFLFYFLFLFTSKKKTFEEDSGIESEDYENIINNKKLHKLIKSLKSKQNPNINKNSVYDPNKEINKNKVLKYKKNKKLLKKDDESKKLIKSYFFEFMNELVASFLENEE